MSRRQKEQQGFSAIELLIALFVAAAFVAAGYQLYSVIIKSGGETQQRSMASDLAYNTMRRYASQASSQCVSSTVTEPVPADSGVPGPTLMTIYNTCPYGSGKMVTKVLVSLKYGTPQQEMIHAIYTNGD